MGDSARLAARHRTRARRLPTIWEVLLATVGFTMTRPTVHVERSWSEMARACSWNTSVVLRQQDGRALPVACRVFGFGDDPKPHAVAGVIGGQNPRPELIATSLSRRSPAETHPQSPWACRLKKSAGDWPLSSIARNAPGVANIRPKEKLVSRWQSDDIGRFLSRSVVHQPVVRREPGCEDACKLIAVRRRFPSCR